MLRSVLAGFVLMCGAAFAEKGTTIEVKLSTFGNNIAFDQQALEVPSGSGPVTLTYVNQAAKGSEILHNVVLLKPGKKEEFIAFIQKNDYDLEKVKKHPAVVGMTKTLRPGETGSIKFTPAEKGFYPYICAMPGHGDMLKMEGVLHVK